jgi:ATP-dependent Clp protease protease subunit
LYDKIEKSKAPIHTIVSGMAMSMGFIILLAGHRRFITKNSIIMYHENAGMGWGKAEELK